MRFSVSSGAWTTRPRFATIVAICPLGTGSTARSAISQEGLHLVEDRRCDLLLRCLRNRPLPGCPEEGHFVLGRVEADVGTGDVVEDEQVCAFADELFPRALEAGVTGLGGEPHEELPVAATVSELREDVC